MVNKNLATALSEAKKRHGWTYRDMAERTGTVANTVLGWTRGARPEPDVWPAIAEMLGWGGADDVAEAVGLPRNQRASDVPTLPPLVADLARSWDRLSEEWRQTVGAVALRALETVRESDESADLEEALPRRAAGRG